MKAHKDLISTLVLFENDYYQLNYNTFSMRFFRTDKIAGNSTELSFRDLHFMLKNIHETLSNIEPEVIK